MDASVPLATGLALLCAVAAGVGLSAWLLPRQRWLGGTAAALGWACLGLAAGTWGVRTATAGHMPLFGTYESSLSLALACLLAAVPVALRGWARAGLWPAVCAVSAALLAHGLRYDPTIYALTISERSWVVDLHAIFAWAAFGALTANAGLALHLLMKRPAEATAASSQSGRPDPVPADPIPGPAGSSGALSWTLSLGFVLHTAMLASGSFYKFLLFGRAWSFDPIETLGFVAWVAYGTLLHMHLFAGWAGRRLAKWCLGLFLILVVSYRGIVYFPAWSTYHIFDMDLRMHLTGGEEIPFGDSP